MIIGISGKIGSGKDTIAKIIQLLVAQSKNPSIDYSLLNKKIISEPTLIQKCNFEESDWEVKKFAGKLKDMVCLLLGCTRAQLEDPLYKNSLLGKEWDRYYSITYNMMGGEVLKEQTNDVNDKVVVMTPRRMLQLLGTEALRDVIHHNVHINALFVDYDNPKVLIVRSDKDKDLLAKHPNWLITDVRFPNEAKAIVDREGILIRVERNKDLMEYTLRTEQPQSPPLEEHPSETALDDYKDWKYIIDNNGTIEKLIQQVNEILIAEGILQA